MVGGLTRGTRLDIIAAIEMGHANKVEQRFCFGSIRILSAGVLFGQICAKKEGQYMILSTCHSDFAVQSPSRVESGVWSIWRLVGLPCCGHTGLSLQRLCTG